MKTAILIDGAFYNKRAKTLFGEKSPHERATELEAYCKLHLYKKHEKVDLYRIFYYDCPPTDKVIFHPFLNKGIHYKQSPLYTWMNDFISELKSKRKFALRLGSLSDTEAHYTLKPEIVKSLFTHKITLEDITKEDFKLSITQKGVDMKIGVDISSMALKKQVDQMILISGDSDFVPAAKLARREGVDFILDPMGQHINADLSEHIDGIRSKIKLFIPEEKIN